MLKHVEKGNSTIRSHSRHRNFIVHFRNLAVSGNQRLEMLDLKVIMKLFLIVALLLTWTGESSIACPMSKMTASQTLVSGDMGDLTDTAMDCCLKTETDPGCAAMMSCGFQISQIDERYTATDVSNARSHIKWLVPSVIVLAGLSTAPLGQPPRS